MNATERVVEVLKRHDPMRGHEPPPFDMAAIRARAAAGDFRVPSRRRRARVALVLFWRRRALSRRRVAAFFGGLLAVGVIVPGSVAFAGPVSPGLNVAALAAVDLPGAAWLNRILAAVPLAAEPPAGPVTYLRQQVWTIETTATSASAAHGVIAQDVQTWRTGDLAGRQCVHVLPPQQPGGQRATHTRPEDAPPPCGQREHPGVLNVPLNAADGTPVTVPADDLRTLAAQLALDQPTADGGEFLLRGVVQTFRFYALDRRRRIAALALLATAPGLRYRGPAVDRAGRAGVAFTITSGAYATGQLEDLVIIDPTDGRLLDHEQIALSFPPRVLAASPATVSYTLILAAETTDRMP